MSAETTAITVSVIIAIVGPVIVYYLTNRRYEQLQTVYRRLIYQKQLEINLPALGFRITYPRAGDIVKSIITVTGTYKKIATDGQVQLYTTAPNGKSAYWPQGIVVFEKNAEKTWRAECHVGEESGYKVTIVAAFLGEDGKALFDYYGKVGNELKEWPSIEWLPSDIITIDMITVEHQ
jgi:hypothetical protein